METSPGEGGAKKNTAHLTIQPPALPAAPRNSTPPQSEYFCPTTRSLLRQSELVWDFLSLLNGGAHFAAPFASPDCLAPAPEGPAPRFAPQSCVSARISGEERGKKSTLPFNSPRPGPWTFSSPASARYGGSRSGTSSFSRFSSRGRARSRPRPCGTGGRTQPSR